MVWNLLSHNARAGGWGEWSSWGDCSRTCGAGAAFRARQCDSPRPAYGGSACKGPREEFRLCGLEECPPIDEEAEVGGDLGEVTATTDFRAEQCANLFEMVVVGVASLEGLAKVGANEKISFTPSQKKSSTFVRRLPATSRCGFPTSTTTRTSSAN